MEMQNNFDFKEALREANRMFAWIEDFATSCFEKEETDNG